jgi:outer membrane cobalamin receptor
MNNTTVSSLVLLTSLLPAAAFAQAAAPPPEPPVTLQTSVQVTATRFNEPVVSVPGAISVVTGANHGFKPAAEY